jgi:hypothetical protein
MRTLVLTVRHEDETLLRGGGCPGPGATVADAADGADGIFERPTFLMILLPARPPERDLQASAHAALRRVRGFGKSVRSSAFILLNAIIDNPHMRAVAQIEQQAYRVLGHAKLFGELKLRPSSRAHSRRARNW